LHTKRVRDANWRADAGLFDSSQLRQADSLGITLNPLSGTAMNSNLRNASPALRQRRGAYGPAIEWEELPSLADSLTRRLVNLSARHGSDFQASSGFHTVWDATMPAALDPLQESGPFTESLSGLVTRELREPDVFRHFFA
jgi:hypothetical protein